MTTDWEKTGQTEPFWGVLTEDAYRSKNICQKDIEKFYLSGQDHVDLIMDNIRNHITKN